MRDHCILDDSESNNSTSSNSSNSCNSSSSSSIDSSNHHEDNSSKNSSSNSSVSGNHHSSSDSSENSDINLHNSVTECAEGGEDDEELFESNQKNNDNHNSHNRSFTKLSVVDTVATTTTMTQDDDDDYDSNHHQNNNTNNLMDDESEVLSHSQRSNSYMGLCGPPPYAATALALTVQEWSRLGVDSITVDAETGATGDLDVLVDRVTSLMLVRVAAVVATTNLEQQQQQHGKNNGNSKDHHVLHDDDEDNTEFYDGDQQRHHPSHPCYPDFSTSTICRTVLMNEKPWHSLTPAVTPKVISQLRQFIYCILSRYNDVPYHSREHAFHVVLSTNKLMDMMLQQREAPTFGLRQDAVQLMALMFAAIIHDVEHQGIPNRQLATESDPLAVQYNDLSIAEQRSLFIAFNELLREEYTELRQTMFGTANVVESEQYRRFRSTVVNLVLNTDIASPERTQLAKSKWKEAFGEKIKRTDLANNNNSNNSNGNNNNNTTNDTNGGRGSLRNRRANNTTTRRRDASRDRSVSDSSDDYTIPITPEPSDSCTDDDDGVIYSSATNAKGAMTTTTATTAKKNNKTLLTVTPKTRTKMIHQKELDKLDSMIHAAANKQAQQLAKLQLEDSEVSGGAFNKDDDVLAHSERPVYGPQESRFETKQNQYQLQQQQQQQKGGNGITSSSNKPHLPYQKSSSLPGKPPMSTIECHSAVRYPRQMSAPHNFHSFRKRLGIRRSMDLSGEALEAYHHTKGRYRRGNSNRSLLHQQMSDDPDELKASVVLETIMTAADVAHNLQGWDQMVKWSGRLYMELRKAQMEGRGMDPKTRWYENQIGFLESYLLPLAQRLGDTGVFGTGYYGGHFFAQIVEQNRDKWLVDGFAVTQGIIASGEDRFPNKIEKKQPYYLNNDAKQEERHKKHDYHIEPHGEKYQSKERTKEEAEEEKKSNDEAIRRRKGQYIKQNSTNSITAAKSPVSVRTVNTVANTTIASTSTETKVPEWTLTIAPGDIRPRFFTASRKAKAKKSKKAVASYGDETKWIMFVIVLSTLMLLVPTIPVVIDGEENLKPITVWFTHHSGIFEAWPTNSINNDDPNAMENDDHHEM